MLYFGAMFWICLIGIFTSGLMILACCIKPCAKVAALLNFLTQIASFIMLILGSVWRFNSPGRACAVNGKTETEWYTSFIKVGTKYFAKATGCGLKAAVNKITNKDGNIDAS